MRLWWAERDATQTFWLTPPWRFSMLSSVTTSVVWREDPPRTLSHLTKYLLFSIFKERRRKEGSRGRRFELISPGSLVSFLAQSEWDGDQRLHL